MIIESLPGWSYEPAHDQFMKRFEQYASYTKNLSNKKIPRNLVINNNFPIGEWSRRIQRNVAAGIPLSKNALSNGLVPLVCKFKKILKIFERIIFSKNLKVLFLSI